MGLSLFNRKIKDTYTGVIKTTDNTALTTTPKTLTDGLGNNLPISAGTSSIVYTGTQDFTGASMLGLPSGPGLYVVKLQFGAGSLDSIVAAQDPEGNDLLTTAGWTFTIGIGNSLTITHPVGKLGTNFETHADRTGGDYLTKAIMGASTSVNSVVQDVVNKDTITIYAMSTTQTGLVVAGLYLYITWTFPTNNWYI